MKKNIGSQKVGAQMVSATDGSAFTGSVTVSVTGDAGTQATGSVGSGACTHEGNGYHTYAPAQAETNYDLVAFTFTGTGAIPATVQIYTRPTTGLLAPATADRTLVVDAAGLADCNVVKLGPSGSGTAQTARDIGTSVLLSSGTGTGQVSLSSGQVLVQSGTGSGQLSVSSGVISSNLTQMGGVAQSATDLKDFADTGYDSSTHKAAANISDATADVALKSLTIINSAGTALHCESSGSSGDGIYAKGNGTNDGLHCVGGATGVGFVAQGGSTSGAGISVLTTNGTGISVVATSGLGVAITGGGTSNGVNIVGGATSGHGISIATFAGDGLNIAAEGGHGAVLTATGSSKHGISATGGDSGTSHGMRLQAGSGGQGLRVDTLTASGATTLTGAVTASNASNSITGVALTSSYDFAKGTTAMTESYATDGSTITPVQILHMIWSALSQFDITSTTITARKIDGTTEAMTFTMDSAAAPTSRTRAT